MMAKIIHNDGYVNTILGHGMKQSDPFAMGKFGGANSWLVDYREADNMYTFNGLALSHYLPRTLSEKALTSRAMVRTSTRTQCAS